MRNGLAINSYHPEGMSILSSDPIDPILPPYLTPLRHSSCLDLPSSPHFLRHDFKRGLSALLNKRLRIKTGCFDVSTGAVASERPVNTCRDLISVEKPIWKFRKAAWHSD